MTPDEHIAALVTAGGAIGALPVEQLGAAVAACPGWDVTRLIGHLGQVHHWAAGFLAGGGDADIVTPEAPRTPEEILPWYREALDRLVGQLGRTDPDSVVGSFAGPTTAAFWFRRQAHETVIHRWDAIEAVAPGTAGPIDEAVAVDGLDEWVMFWFDRVLSREGLPEDIVGSSLHVHCTDDGLAEGTGEWLVSVTRDGPVGTRKHAKGDAALRGPANDLLLTTWNRRPLDSVDVVGDIATARRLLDVMRV